MQHLGAPVSVNALHIVVPTLVGNVVPCSDPMTTSYVLCYVLLGCLEDKG